MGGDVVKRSVRSYIAVIVKHLGLTQKAHAFATGTEQKVRWLVVLLFALHRWSELRAHHALCVCVWCGTFRA